MAEQHAAVDQILPASGDENTWTDTQRALIVAMGLIWTDKQSGQVTLAPRHVVEAFLYTCRRSGLDPLAKQVYSIARWDSQSGGPKWTTQTAIDGFRVIAERHGQYAGQGDVQWLTDDGRWVDVFVPNAGGMGAHPLAARATVLRHDFAQPLRAIALWDAYAAGGSFWAGAKGVAQLAKCAEALALRKAFPQDLSGLYTSDEMEQASADTAQPAALPAGTGGNVQAQPAQQHRPQPSAAVREVDPGEQQAWWDRMRALTFKGKRGSGDGGARDFHRLLKEAGVLSWPIGPNETDTFGDTLMRLAATLPEEAPGPESAEQPLEDPPMALADPVPAAQPQQAPVAAAQPQQAPQHVPEPQAPAPAGAQPQAAVQPLPQDETDPDVPPWAHAAPQEDAWTTPQDADEEPM